MNTSMHSLMMERGRQKLHNVLEDGLSKDLMDAGRFCFSCEQIFANRKSLEEHICSSTSFICSCGTEFAEYKDMQLHSTTHEPGHQVLDHGTIKKRRIEKRIAEEEQLKRLQTGEVVWKAPKSNNVPSISLPVNPMRNVPITSAFMPQIPMQSAQISQVPQLYQSMSQASMPPNPNPVPRETDMQNIFAGVGAPTVDLWTLYQPVVLLQTVRKFNKTRLYTCGKCGQCFLTKTSLIAHHSTHVTDKVSGCIGCGLLLSSKKMVPRYHYCKARKTPAKFRIITARPLSSMMPKLASTMSNHGPRAAPSLQLKTLNPSAASKGFRAPLMTSSTLQSKNQKVRAYNRTPQKLYFSPSLQLKSQNPSAPNKSTLGLHAMPSVQLKMPTKSLSGVQTCRELLQTSSTSSGFPCRVCHLPFDSAQLLQRHKCVKAQEFMARHVPAGKQRYRLKRVTPMGGPNPGQINGERRVAVPVSGYIKSNQVMAVRLDQGQGAVPVNGSTEVDMDDDCYIVEKGPAKPAEMIYQVTSSVPIKT